MKKFINSGQFKPANILEGDRFHSWTVINFLGKIKKWGNLYWECRCDCGTIAPISASNLINGRSKACKSGVHQKGRNATHGMKYTRIYNTWKNMKARCINPKCEMYYQYGGRGIKVCERWVKFENFYEDMKDGYDDTLSLERIDVNGDYYKENCKWVTMIEQARNKTNTAYLTYKGITKRAAEWAKIIGANPRTVVRRVYLGYSPEECLFGKQYDQIRRLILAENSLNI